MYLNSSQALVTTALWSGSWGDASTYHGWFKTKQNHKSKTKGRSQGWHKYYINLKVEVQDVSVIQKKPIPLGTKWNLLWLCPWDRSNSELNGSQLMKQAHLHKDTSVMFQQYAERGNLLKGACSFPTVWVPSISKILHWKIPVWFLHILTATVWFSLLSSHSKILCCT